MVYGPFSAVIRGLSTLVFSAMVHRPWSMVLFLPWSVDCRTWSFLPWSIVYGLWSFFCRGLFCHGPSSMVYGPFSLVYGPFSAVVYRLWSMVFLHLLRSGTLLIILISKPDELLMEIIIQN